MISGLVTAALLLSFVGMTAWAWSARSRTRFAEAAHLVFDDEELSGSSEPRRGVHTEYKGESA